MGKFRGVAVSLSCSHYLPYADFCGLERTTGLINQHASQQHDLSLHSYYSSLLQTLQTAHSSAHLHDNTSLSLLLTRLSTLLRSALRSLGGEEPEIDLTNLLSLSIPSGTGHSDDSGPSSPKSVSSGKKSIQKPPSRTHPFPGFVPGTNGGYSGTEGQGDWALEREMEILRLEEENESLRQLLAIAEESPAAQAVQGDMKEEEEEKGTESPDPSGMVRRKSSLTVEELEAGAEAEEIEKERAVEAGLIDETGKSLVSDHGQFDIDDEEDGGENAHLGPGTGLGGGRGPSKESQRQNISESLLGIRSEVEQEAMGLGSAIEDDPEVGDAGEGGKSAERGAGVETSQSPRVEEAGKPTENMETLEHTEEVQRGGGDEKQSNQGSEQQAGSDEEQGLAL